jgi:hypothetical protein
MDQRRVSQFLRTPIVLALLLVLLAGGAWWGYHLVVTGARPTQPTPCVTVSLTELQPQNVVVRVYNGGSERGLAGQVAKTLKTAGFVIVTTGNTDEPIHDTIVVGVSADSPEVQFVAAWFDKVTTRADGRPDHTVDVLVGDSGAPMVAEPPQSLALSSGQACLPTAALPTPEPSPTAATEAPA